MSHDFRIRCIKGDQIIKAYFFGYADGIIYHAFNDHKFNNGVSGSGETSIHTWEEVDEALPLIFNSPACKRYPDPTRFDELKTFYNNLSLVHKDTDFECEYF